MRSLSPRPPYFLRGPRLQPAHPIRKSGPASTNPSFASHTRIATVTNIAEPLRGDCHLCFMASGVARYFKKGGSLKQQKPTKEPNIFQSRSYICSFSLEGEVKKNGLAQCPSPKYDPVYSLAHLTFVNPL